MEEIRPDPEALLRKLKKEEEQALQKQRGRLKIFLGFAAGVGKTYAMLEAAREELARGRDVAAGYIEPHDRPDTRALAEGLEEIPPLMVEYKGILLREFDLDAALKRRPRLLLVDELAHTNAPGLRHEKRYQDVEELLQAGISVYTTVNIQHLESLNDQVGSITGIRVRERIPDSVFDRADQVEVVDIEPEELIARLKEGKIYRQGQAERALEHFFARDKLIALREIALRRTADRVNRLAVLEREEGRMGEYHTGEHILICISPSPTCPRVIRTASRLAYAFHGELTALYVETPSLQEAGEKVRKMTEDNIRLARALGARIVTVYGEDIAGQIAEYARVGNVSKLVLGRTNHRIFFGQTRGTLADRIALLAPGLDIYIIPDVGNAEAGQNGPAGGLFWWGRRAGQSDTGGSSHSFRQSGPGSRPHSFRQSGPGGRSYPFRQSVWADCMKMLLALILSTLAGYVFLCLGLSEANIIMVYLVGVLVTAMYCSRRLCSAAASVLSVLLFNFFFTEPLLSLHADGKEYPFTFAVMLAVGLVTSSLMNTVRRQSGELAKKAWRTELLLDNSRRLRRTGNAEEVIREVSSQIRKLMNLPVLFYLYREGRLQGPVFFAAQGEGHMGAEELNNREEKAVALWAAGNGRAAGACTRTLPDAKALYLPVQNGERVYAVMGIALEERREIPPFEYGLLTAMLNEAALVFERIEAVSATPPRPPEEG